MKEAFKSRRKRTFRWCCTLLKARCFKNRLVWLCAFFLQITNGSAESWDASVNTEKQFQWQGLLKKKKKNSPAIKTFLFFSLFFFIHQVNRCCIFCDTRTRLHYSSCSDLPRDTFRYGSVGLWVGDKLPLNEWAARPKLHHAEVWRRQRGTAQLSARGVINAPSFEAIPHPPLYHQPPPPKNPPCNTPSHLPIIFYLRGGMQGHRL